MEAKTARAAAAVKAGKIALLRKQQKKAKRAAQAQRLAAVKKAAQQRHQQQLDDTPDDTECTQSQERPPSPRPARKRTQLEHFTPAKYCQWSDTPRGRICSKPEQSF
jgi:hypothetical protein